MRCLRSWSPIPITKHDPTEYAKPGKEEEWAVEEDMSALRDHATFEEDEDTAEECGACAAAEFKKGWVSDGDQCDASGCWEETHGDVGDIGGVYGPEVFEIQGAVGTPHEGSECEDEFSERWMDVDVVQCLKR
jgi:hypothetical protein